MAATIKPPKGGRKGGASFPRIPLEEAATHAKKLAAKTQVAPLAAVALYQAVFGVKGRSTGEIKLSALKQYGFLAGNSEGFKASAAATELAAAVPEELPKLYKVACVRPKVFKSLYEVFQGDTVSLSRVRQHAVSIGVHLDSAEACAEMFAQSLVFAGLATRTGDELTVAAVDVATAESGTQAENASTSDDSGRGPAEPPKETSQPAAAPQQGTPSGRSIIQINVSLDSSLDTEKLEKQLALLRRFGAI